MPEKLRRLVRGSDRRRRRLYRACSSVVPLRAAAEAELLGLGAWSSGYRTLDEAVMDWHAADTHLDRHARESLDVDINALRFDCSGDNGKLAANGE